MDALADHAGDAAHAAYAAVEHDLYLRVQGEFREMPGLRLTLRQAARLFSIEEAECERVLNLLVQDGVLSRDGLIFAAAGAGRKCA
jgi:hypothetical protein